MAKIVWFSFDNIWLWEQILVIFFRNGPNFSCLLDVATSSGILKAKQKLGVTFNSDKLGGIDFTKILKLTMCSA